MDDYNDKQGRQTLRRLERKYGPLPPAPTIINRPGESGTRLFRVPEGMKWPSEAGDGIDVIQYRHRYAIAPPSQHPDGREYGWSRPDGSSEIPSVAELPELPERWVKGLTGGEAAEPIERVAVDDQEWLTEHGAGEMCAEVERTLSAKLRALTSGGSASRHSLARTTTQSLAYLAAEGHSGVLAALLEYGEAFVAAIGSDRAGAAGEYERMVGGAVEIAAARTIETSDPCDLFAGATSGGVLGRVLSRADLAKLPKPEPLIEGLLDLRTAVIVVGDTGTNKTFALLGWACSVATGEPWLGHSVAVDPSPVLLVVGEGGSGLDSRISAWEAEHNMTADNLTVLLQPVSINEESFWEKLSDYAGALGARFVALDTFSSLAPDADETTDAAMVVRRMSQLASDIGGTVLLAHHTGWADKGRARGGSQLEANPDAVIVFQKVNPEDPESVVSIRRKKVKDGPAGHTIHVRRVPIADSCVLELADDPPAKASGQTFAEQDERALRILDDEGQFVLTQTKWEGLIGGHSEKRAAIAQRLLDAGVVVVRKAEALEGENRMVTRKRVGRAIPIKVNIARSELDEPRPATETARSELDE